MAAPIPMYVPTMLRLMKADDFEPEITTNDAAAVAVFENHIGGRPFFHALEEDPNAIGFTYTDRGRNVDHDKLILKDDMGTQITVPMLTAMGFHASKQYLPHFIFENRDLGRTPHFRESSSNPDAITITYTDNGLTNNVRLFVYRQLMDEDGLYDIKKGTDYIRDAFRHSYARFIEERNALARVRAQAPATRGGKRRKSRRSKTRRTKTRRSNRHRK